jgi:TonB family protein
MTNHPHDSRTYFFPAVILSFTLHGFLLGASFWLPSAPQVAVLEAPNTPEIHVLQDPVVTVLEEEIFTKIVMKEEIPDGLIVRDHQVMDRPVQRLKPVVASQKLQGAVTAAKPLMHVNPAPSYPPIARERGWEGTVRLEVLVEQDGHPSAVGIERSSGHAALDDSAVQAVRQWKFSPARSGAMRFSSKIIIPVQFTLLKE